jgi:hypothetical protein
LERSLGNREVGRQLQAKLQVSQPEDAHEHEADRVAKDVVTLPNPQAPPKTSAQEAGQVSPFRTITESTAGRGASAVGNAEVDDDIAQKIEQSIGHGSPLPHHDRSFLEPRFGADFSGVRIHTGQLSNELNESLSAEAFTVGSDIYYGAGKSPSDVELTAHELTHVVQQGGAGAASRDAASRGHMKGPSGSEHPTAHAAPTVAPGLSRRIIQRRPIPPGALPVPTQANTVDGSIVVAKLTDMGKEMWRGFDGFSGTQVEWDVLGAFGTGNLAQRSIAINFLDERGMNKFWTGTVRIGMDNATPVQGPGGSGIGKITSAGGGTGTSGTTASTSDTSGISSEVSAGGHEGAAAGKVGGQTSTTRTQGSAQGATGTATTGGETVDQLQRYECTVVADIYLKCEMDVSGSDYVNPFKWGVYGVEAISSIKPRTASVPCGRWTYSVSKGFAPTPAPAPAP